MVLDMKVTTNKESKMGKVGLFDLTESNWAGSSSRIRDMGSAITWSRRQMKACMVSLKRTTLMAWPSHMHIVTSQLNTLITDNSRMVDPMASEYSSMKMAQSMKARLKTGKKTGSDFRGINGMDPSAKEHGKKVVILNRQLQLDELNNLK